MDESTIRGMILLDLNRQSMDREIRISVEGYDNSLAGDEPKIALRRHFSSCGTIVNILLPKEDDNPKGCVIHIRGEDAEKKALELNGSGMRGWKLVVKRFKQLNPTRKSGSGCVDVTGFDISLPRDVIKRALTNISLHVGKSGIRNARVYIKGEGAVEKAVKLNGCGSECECDVLGCKFVASEQFPRGTVRGRQSTGYTVPVRCIPKGKRAKV